MYITSDSLGKKPPRHLENMKMMFNHAGYVFEPCIVEKEKLHNQWRSMWKPVQMNMGVMIILF